MTTPYWSDFVPNSTFYRILTGLHRIFATGVAYRQGTLTHLDTWSRPNWDLHMFYLLRQIQFPNLQFFRTMLFEYPSVLSRFCFFNCNVNRTTWSNVYCHGYIVYLRNECLFFSVHGKWIAVRNKQIAWTAKRFSCDLFVPHCDSFPMTEKKRHSFLIFTMPPTKIPSKILRAK